MCLWIHQNEDSKYQTATSHKSNYTVVISDETTEDTVRQIKLEDIFWRMWPKEVTKEERQQYMKSDKRVLAPQTDDELIPGVRK